MTRSMPIRRARLLLRARRGASTAEFAIVIPIFLLLMLGIFEFARAFWVANTLQFAVSQGARYAMTRGTALPKPGTCAADLGAYQTSLRTYLQNQLAAVLPSATVPAPTGSCNVASSPRTVTVTLTVSYNFNFWLVNLSTLLGTPVIQQRATVTTPLS